LIRSFVLAASILLVLAGRATAGTIALDLFWSESCPHCREALPAAAAMAAERPWIDLRIHEVSAAPANVLLYRRMAAELGEEALYVPAFIFCGEMHTGFDPKATPALLAERLEACRARGGTAAGGEPEVALPWLGRLDTRAWSLPVLTVTLAGLDAFNPCAFFVLLFLLSLMVHAKSRGRMLAVGGLFVAVSGLAYFAFMAAWLNLFVLVGHLPTVTLAAGLVAVLLGAINIRDSFRAGEPAALAIPEAAKPRLFARMRGLIGAPGLAAMLGGTAVLAVAANGYELLCTAGFPMVFTRVLTLRVADPAAQYLYLAFYNLVYVLPLLAIVAAFAFTLGQRRLGEAEGRSLKLLSGLMMLGLGGVLVLAPELVEDPRAALGLAGGALVVALIAHRRSREQTDHRP
jgi:hypothetical protein